MLKFPFTVNPGDTITDEHGNVIFRWQVKYTYVELEQIKYLMVRLARSLDLPRRLTHTPDE